MMVSLVLAMNYNLSRGNFLSASNSGPNQNLYVSEKNECGDQVFTFIGTCVCVIMYVCMYACLFVCVYVGMHLYVIMCHEYMYACMYVNVCTYKHACVCLCLCMHL